jgi:hypothetical protein
MAHNVLAVYDIFASPGNRRFPGLAKMWVGWSVGGAAGLSEPNPRKVRPENY